MTRKILNGLSDEFECHCLAHNYFGRTIVPPIKFRDDEEGINFYVHGTGKAKYAMDMIKPIIDQERIDIFGILLDTFMPFESGFMTIDTSPAHTFFYFPSDGGGGLPLGCDVVLRKVELPIAMAEFARDQTKKAHGIDSICIPHGYDPKVFYKEFDEKRIELRKAWGVENKFVVGSVFRNQGRKMPDRLLKAFKIFSRTHPDAVLLLHTDPDDQARTFNMQNLINRFQLNNRVIFTGGTFHKPLSHDTLREIYNIMDVFMLSTSGEGFGVPIVEAMACGVPQLVTDYTTTKELVVDAPKTGLAIKLAGENDYCPYPHTNEVLDGTITGGWDVERGLMSVYDGDRKLSELYEMCKNNTEEWKTIKTNCLLKAESKYSWDVIIPQFKDVLRKLVNDNV